MLDRPDDRAVADRSTVVEAGRSVRLHIGRNERPAAIPADHRAADAHHRPQPGRGEPIGVDRVFAFGADPAGRDVNQGPEPGVDKADPLDVRDLASGVLDGYRKIGRLAAGMRVQRRIVHAAADDGRLVGPFAACGDQADAADEVAGVVGIRRRTDRRLHARRYGMAARDAPGVQT